MTTQFRATPTLLRDQIDRYGTPVLITLFAAVLRMFHLGYHSLWYDETSTAWTVAQSSRDIIWIALQDVVHPPLYHSLLSGWTRLVGNSEVALRSLSAAVRLLGVPLLYRLGRLGWGRKAGLAAAALWACALFALWYAQEARQYALVTVLGLAAVLCLARALSPRSSTSQIIKTLPWIAANALLNLAGLHVHYFYLFLLLSQDLYLILTVRQNRRIFWFWTLSNGVAALLYLPWLLKLIRGGLGRAQIAWISPLGLEGVLSTYWELLVGPNQPLHVPTLLIALALTGGLVAGVAVRRDRRQSPVQGLSWMLLLVPLLLVVVISLRQPLLCSRFLQIVLPFYLLLAAAGFAQLPRAWMSGMLVGLVILAMLSPLAAMYRAPARHEHKWPEAMDYLGAHAALGDSVAFRGGQGSHAYWDHYDGAPLEGVNLSPSDDIEDLGAMTEATGTVWLVLWDTKQTCEPPSIFVPGTHHRLELADSICFPEIIILSYAWPEQKD